MDFQEEIKIKLRAFDHRALDKAVTDIIGGISKIGAKFKGPIPMPMKIKGFTVNSSPHVYKKAREQLEIRYHSRLIIIEASSETIDALMKLDVASGVDIEIKMSEAKVVGAN